MGTHKNQSKMYPVTPASFILLLKRIGSHPSFWLLIHAIYALRVRRRRNRSSRFKAAKHLTRDRHRQQAGRGQQFHSSSLSHYLSFSLVNGCSPSCLFATCPLRSFLSSTQLSQVRYRLAVSFARNVVPRRLNGNLPPSQNYGERRGIAAPCLFAAALTTS